MTTTFHAGPELDINQVGGKELVHSAVVALSDGRYIVSWAKDVSHRNQSFHAQIFNADGSHSGSEIDLGNGWYFDEFLNYGVVITALDNGGFVSSWSDLALAGSNLQHVEIYAQVHDATGAKVGDPFVATATTANWQVVAGIDTLQDGRFILTWLDDSDVGADKDAFAIRGQIFNADGTRSGGEFQVNTTAKDTQLSADVSGLPDGKFVITWMDGSQTWPDTSIYGIRMQIFNSDGTKFGAEQLVNSTTVNSQGVPKVAALADGRFVITWSDASYTGADPSGYSVRAQIFYANGWRYGTEFVVNTTTDYSQLDSQVTGLPDGKFVITWSDSSISGDDLSDWAVRAQVFNANGTRFGEEFLVNTTVEHDQNGSAIETLADGRFIITWSDEGRDSNFSTQDITGQIFDTREEAIQLSGSALDDQFVGTEFADRISGGDGDDRLWGGNRRDVLNGDLGRDRLFGDAGNDILRGAGGQDRLNGGGGADRLNGGGGRDILRGGNGDDLLVGGAGPDRFIFSRGHDVVGDFDALDRREKIDLSKVASITGFADLTAQHMTQIGQNVVIDDLGGNTLTLNGVNLADLGADDFLF